MRILLVEDDILIGNGLAAGLPMHGFSVDWFKEGTAGCNAVSAASYDAAILDLGLPGLDGLDIMRAWRAAGHTVPVLVLTARDTTEQRVEGLNLGADDYLGKPFDLDEVAARLRALIRRRHGAPVPLLQHGALSFNPASRLVLLGDQPVALGPKEMMLLEILLLHKGHTLSKASLEEKLYTWGEEAGANAIEVLVHRIRRKLGPASIKTVHGIGYQLGESLWKR